MPEVPDTPDTGKTEAGKKTTDPPGKGWVRFGFVVFAAIVLASAVAATAGAHLFVRLLEWAWTVSG